MNAANDEAKYLTAQELSDRYRGEITVRTLANWRCLGVGPRYLKCGGRVIYPLHEVVAWERARTVGSTSSYARTA